MSKSELSVNSQFYQEIRMSDGGAGLHPESVFSLLTVIETLPTSSGISSLSGDFISSL